LAVVTQPFEIIGAPGKDRTCGTWIRKTDLWAF